MCLNSYSEHWKRKDLLESNQPELLTELSDNQCVHTASHSLTHSLTHSVFPAHFVSWSQSFKSIFRTDSEPFKSLQHKRSQALWYTPLIQAFWRVTWSFWVWGQLVLYIESYIDRLKRARAGAIESKRASERASKPERERERVLS